MQKLLYFCFNKSIMNIIPAQPTQAVELKENINVLLLVSILVKMQYPIVQNFSFKIMNSLLILAFKKSCTVLCENLINNVREICICDANNLESYYCLLQFNAYCHLVIPQHGWFYIHFCSFYYVSSHDGANSESKPTFS